MKTCTSFVVLIAAAAAAVPGPAFHDYAETVALLDSLAAEYPTLCALDSVGFSTRDSMAIWLFKVSDNPSDDEDEAAILFCDAGHSEEIMGTECILDLAQYLLANYGVDTAVTRIVDTREVLLVPNCNPDGHEVVLQGLDYYYRKTKRDNNGNGVFDYDPDPPSGPPGWIYDPDPDGVDVNRNFDFNWTFGDPTPGEQDYRGPSPFSEDEARIQDSLVGLFDPTVAVFFHSAIQGRSDSTKCERLFYPWAWNGVTYSVDFEILKNISFGVATLILNQDRTGTYWGGLWWTSRRGDAKDYLYHEYGTFAYELEVGRDIHPPDTVMQRIVDDVRPGLVYFLNRLDGPGVTGIVFDSLSALPLEAEVRILELYDPTDMLPRMSDPATGRYRRLLFADSSYTLQVSAPGYFTKTIQFTCADSINVVDVPLRSTTDAPDVASSPADFVLYPPHPNPFNPSVTISFNLPEAAAARVDVFDVLGRRVRALAEHQFSAGKHSLSWDGMDDGGLPVASGVYFVRIQSGERALSGKLVLLR